MGNGSGKCQFIRAKAEPPRGGGSHIFGWLDRAKGQQFAELQAWAGCELMVITAAVPPIAVKARRAMSKSFFMTVSSKRAQQFELVQAWAGCELMVITAAVPPITAKARRAMSKSFFMTVSFEFKGPAIGLRRPSIRKANS